VLEAIPYLGLNSAGFLYTCKGISLDVHAHVRLLVCDWHQMFVGQYEKIGIDWFLFYRNRNNLLTTSVEVDMAVPEVVP
jgi:hypothetical protein